MERFELVARFDEYLVSKINHCTINCISIIHIYAALITERRGVMIFTIMTVAVDASFSWQMLSQLGECYYILVLNRRTYVIHARKVGMVRSRKRRGLFQLT